MFFALFLECCKILWVEECWNCEEILGGLSIIVLNESLWRFWHSSFFKIKVIYCGELQIFIKKIQHSKTSSKYQVFPALKMKNCTPQKTWQSYYTVCRILNARGGCKTSEYIRKNFMSHVSLNVPLKTFPFFRKKTE